MELTMWPRIVLNLRPTCLCLLSARIKGVHRQILLPSHTSCFLPDSSTNAVWWLPSYSGPCATPHHDGLDPSGTVNQNKAFFSFLLSVMYRNTWRHLACLWGREHWPICFPAEDDAGLRWAWWAVFLLDTGLFSKPWGCLNSRTARAKRWDLAKKEKKKKQQPPPPYGDRMLELQ